MRKRMVAITLCLIMVSAFAVTGAASAASKSPIRQYDRALADNGVVVGRITVNLDTGKWVANTVAQRGDYKDSAKENNVGKSYDITAFNAGATPQEITIGQLTYNKGGTAHGEGTLDKNNPDDAAKLAWLAEWGDTAQWLVY